MPTQLELFGAPRLPLSRSLSAGSTKTTSASSPSVLVSVPTAGATLEQLVERAASYAAAERAPATRRAYATDFEMFEVWCREKGLPAMPAAPSTLAVYVAALADAGRRVSTIERALAGIADAHRRAGLSSARAHPAVRAVMTGIRRELGIARRQKAALADRELAALVATLDDDLRGLRDRALLTLGWFGAFRRAELVALVVADLERAPEGLVVLVRRSKHDQEGRGAKKGIPFAERTELCAVRAIEAWLRASGITAGALFRVVSPTGRIGAEALSDRAVARIVQRAALRAGLDARSFAGHSLRAGFVTTAARLGKSLDAIMRQTLHRSERVARGYVRHVGVFDDCAAKGIV